MDNSSKELLVQAAVMGLQVVFTQLKMAGKTDDEILQIFSTEKMKFTQNKPAALPDV